MSLDDLEREEFIKKLPVDQKKIQDSIRLAARDISSAKTMLNTDFDWAFSIAYNAMLQTLRAFMFSKGYRPAGGNQHLSVVRFSEVFLDDETVAVFDRMRRKRHVSIYDTVGSISKKEAEYAINQAEHLHQKIKTMLNQ